MTTNNPSAPGPAPRCDFFPNQCCFDKMKEGYVCTPECRKQVGVYQQVGDQQRWEQYSNSLGLRQLGITAPRPVDQRILGVGPNPYGDQR